MRPARACARPTATARAGTARIDGSLAPEAAHNHPTEEHLLPLYVALGVAPDKVNHLHQSTTYGILRMDAFAFG